MNSPISQHIIKNLLLQGITDFCICAGGRNVPLISTLVSLKEQLPLNFYEFFDENSASFFALGRAKSTKKPVVVITTSGTAVAETLPAMLEAKYSNTPIIILSADRPKEYRNSYAPQTINQTDIFQHLNINHWDLDKNNFQEFNFTNPAYKQSHINVSFVDPIVFDDKSKLDFKTLGGLTEAFDSTSLRAESSKTSVRPPNVLKSQSGLDNSDGLGTPNILDNQNLSLEDNLYFSQFLSDSKRPLVLVSKVDLTNNTNLINLLLKLNTFIYLEAGSKLWGDRKLELLLLKAGEVSLEKAFEEKLFDCVIKIGSTPTIKFWRLLEDKFNHVPVLSVVEHGGSGLSWLKKTLKMQAFLNAFLNGSLSSMGVSGSWGRDSSWKAKVKKLDEDFYKEKIIQCKNEPFSEKALVRGISEVFSLQDNIFLGNSLSIRHWDSVAVKKAFVSVESHRGLNGIDGLVSGFLGWVSGVSDKNKSWALLGDLSALYDLNALWISKQLINKNWAIIVMNNSGGKIFKPLFNQEILEAKHDLNFQHWAKMFHCPYIKIEAKDFSKSFNKDLKGIIEIAPNKCEI